MMWTNLRGPKWQDEMLSIYNWLHNGVSVEPLHGQFWTTHCNICSDYECGFTLDLHWTKTNVFKMCHQQTSTNIGLWISFKVWCSELSKKESSSNEIMMIVALWPLHLHIYCALTMTLAVAFMPRKISGRLYSSHSKIKISTYQWPE